MSLYYRAVELLVSAGQRRFGVSIDDMDEAERAARGVIIPAELWVYHERHQAREHLYTREFLPVPCRENRSPRNAVWPHRRSRRAFEPSGFQDIHAVDVDGSSVPSRRFTSPYNPISNLTGFPALSLPVGALGDGSPISISLIGPPMGEALLLQVAAFLEAQSGNLVQKWGIEPKGAPAPRSIRS